MSVPVFDAVLLINSLLTKQGKRQAKVETSGSDKAALATQDCGEPIHKTTNCVNSIHILYTSATNAHHYDKQHRLYIQASYMQQDHYLSKKNLCIIGLYVQACTSTIFLLIYLHFQLLEAAQKT